MKAILEFDLDSPDDRCAHRTAVDAAAVRCAIWEFDQWLRSETKYAQASTKRVKALQEARDRLYECFNTRDVTFND